MTELDTIEVDGTIVNVIDPHITADSLEPGDQIVIGEELVIIWAVDNDRPDPDEVFINVENLSGGDTEFSLHADDTYTLWSM